jgi:hypothetical protein
MDDVADVYEPAAESQTFAVASEVEWHVKQNSRTRPAAHARIKALPERVGEHHLVVPRGSMRVVAVVARQRSVERKRCSGRLDAMP